MSEGLGYFRFARRYSGNHGCFLFLGLLRCFTSPRWLDTAYVFSGAYCGMTRSGLPHSDIAGSKAASASPTLIAGNHVLHRLLVPRHPPYALCNFSEISIDTRTRPTLTERRCIDTTLDEETLMDRFVPDVSGVCASRQSETATDRTRLNTSSELSKNKTPQNPSRGIVKLVELRGIEPLTPSLQSWCSPN